MGCCPCCSASAIDAEEAIKKVQEECPEILIESEAFLFCFKFFMGDELYFTSHRVLVRDKRGFTQSSIAWRTIPYSSMQAFWIETAGSLDPSVELGFWPSGLTQGDGFQREALMKGQSVKFEFKGNGGVNLFALQRLLNQKIFPTTSDTLEVAPQPEGMDDASKMSTFTDMLCGDARAIDPKLLEEQLRSDPPILLPDEKVDMAFKCGRDTTAFTSKRFLSIDVQGITGLSIKYTSILWSSIRAFAVDTPGFLIDRDCEVKLWTTVQHITENVISLDLKAASIDIMAVQRYLSDRILGQDTAPPSDEGNSKGEGEDSSAGWQGWLCGDMRQLDAGETNTKFHTEVKILQGCETCEMAFKAARDMVLFTTKRMILIDPQGITGQKVEYKSIPWGTIQAFAVQSAGAFIDKDAEMLIWTDIFYGHYTEEEEYGKNDDGSPKKRTIYLPTPDMSYFKVDFQKDRVDLAAIGRYLASRCAVLGSQSSLPPVPVQQGTLDASDPGMFETFFSWLGSDYRQCDPNELNQKLHGECSMLLPDEIVQMGFVCGRDTVVMTSHRAMKIDVQGFTGKQILYLSIPYTKVKAYEVASCGTFDMDAEMSITIKAPWYNREHGKGLEVDFSKGRCDVINMSQYLSCQVIGAADGTSAVPTDIPAPQPDGLVDQLLLWISNDSTQFSRAESTQRFRSIPPLLMPDESVDIAYKCGRDLSLFTTKRFIKVDVCGMTGKKVKYTSLPWAAVPCYEVVGAAAHPFDNDAEVNLFADAGPNKAEQVKLEVSKMHGDINSTYILMNKKCIIDKLIQTE